MFKINKLNLEELNENQLKYLIGESIKELSRMPLTNVQRASLETLEKAMAAFNWLTLRED